MNSESLEAEHFEIKSCILIETVMEVESCDEFFDALTILMRHDIPHICAIIDTMSILAGAMIFNYIKLKTLTEDKNIFYEAIVERCEKLQMKVVKGLVYAQNEFFRQTGEVTTFFDATLN